MYLSILFEFVEPTMWKFPKNQLTKSSIKKTEKILSKKNKKKLYL